MMRIITLLYTLKICSSFTIKPFELRLRYCNENTALFAGGGFGGGGGKKGKTKKGVRTKSATLSQKKKLQIKEKLLKSYGGDIAKGTEERMKKAMASLEPHMQDVAELYRKVQRWEASIARLSLMQQNQIPPRDLEGAKLARAELQMYYEKYEINEKYMHNLFQQITWDASADAKAVRASIGEMPPQILERIEKACGIIADAVKLSGRKEGRCLDVGCGHGTLIPNLTNAGIYANQITGIDLSPEMIRNAKERYRGPLFLATDFLQFDGKPEYDGVIFCSSLHDLPEMKLSLEKASMMLREKGKIVIVHAQGGMHVLGQHKANPVLVRRGLPSEDELIEWANEMSLILEYFEPASDEDYLAVLKK